MEFQFIDLLPSSWAYALFLTLFHSLWIGLLAALLGGLTVLVTKNSSANIRYRILISLLFAFAGVMGLVFYQSFSAANTVVDFSAKKNLAQITSPATEHTYLLANFKSIVDFFGNYASEIVLIWFLIFCIKSVRFLIGLRDVYVLKHHEIFDAGNFWKGKLENLSAKMKVNRSIQIFQSGLAKVPLVVGHLKPFILIPIGMFNNLTIEQAEAVLAHELAHIKRRDYLVNMIQSFVEIVFFFNPALLWLSNLIKEERENCCDDLALQCTADKRIYISALISCQENILTKTTHAMAITGRKNQLLARVRRMASNHGTSLNKMEKAILSITLISAVIFSLAVTDANSKEMKQTVQEVQKQKKANSQDTTKKKKFKTVVISKKPVPKTKLRFKSKVANDSIIEVPITPKKTDSNKMQVLELKTKTVKLDSLQIALAPTKVIEVRPVKEVQIRVAPVKTLKLEKKVDSIIEIRMKPTKLKLSPVEVKPAPKLKLQKVKPTTKVSEKQQTV